MKLCVYQGTFNPIHNAHLNVASYVKEQFSYDKILFIPAYKPPHKEANETFSTHRLEMVRCAIQNIEGFELSDIEFESENISYTYLTIKELYKRYNIEGKIGFIIGTDAFYHLLDWYETDKLKELVEFILFKRSDTIDENRLALLSKKGYKFNITDMEFLDISSTMVREKIARGESVENLVSQSVLEYIEKNELYRK